MSQSSDTSSEHLGSLTGAYAADALDPLERARFERHLAECETCADEVRSFTETTARLAGAVAVAPPSTLRERVLAEVAHTRQESPLTGPVHRRPPLTRFANRWLAVAAAVAALAVVLGGLAWQQNQEAQRAERFAAAVREVMSDPQRQVVDTSFGTGRGTVVIAGDRVLVIGDDVAPPGPDRTFQLWFMGERPRSAGLLRPAAPESYWAEASGIRAGDAIGVTVEPAGGSPRPTGDPVLLVKPSTS